MLRGMLNRFLTRVVVLGVAAARLMSAPALAHQTKHHGRAAAVADYINPFTDPGWVPSRTDMGVDWVPLRPEPVLAIGNGVILGADWHAPWPGGRIIWYQLTDGSHAGDVIYVAEDLRHLLPAGTVVTAGEKIAVALPAYPYSEWGWADQYGTPLAFPCYHDGHPTRSGKRMARFMEELGAQVGDPVALQGADGPGGPLC
jgi:hypothetical protein